MGKIGKWIYNNILVSRWVPMGAGCAMVLVCGINDLWGATIVGFALVLFPTALQALGYEPME